MGADGTTVAMVCLYTSCTCGPRRSRTEKLSKPVMLPCSLTPLDKKIVTGIFFLRSVFKNTSWIFCDFSAAMWQSFFYCYFHDSSIPEPAASWRPKRVSTQYDYLR